MKATHLYNNKVPIKLIARQLGVSEATVGRMLDREACNKNRRGGTRIPKDKAKLSKEMLENGCSWREISRTIGPSVKALKKAIEYYAAQGII